MAAANFFTPAAFLLIGLFANGALGCPQQAVAAQPASSLQAASALPDQEAEQVLQQMTFAAGVIFAGEVVSVQRPSGYAGSGLDAADGIVSVRFRVDEAVRGCVSNSIYILREWSGLWAGGDRFRIGQHLLVFLYSPNASGVGSPVHGAEGAIPLRGGGVAPGPYDVSATAAGWLVDLSWVRAAAFRGTQPRPVNPVSGPAHGPVSEALPTSGRVPTPAAMRDPIPGRARQTVAMNEGNDAAGYESMPELLLRAGSSTHWTALPRTSDRAMPPLAGVLSLCRAWARSADGRQ